MQKLSIFAFVVGLFIGCDFVDFSVDEKIILEHEMKVSFAIERLYEAMDKYKSKSELVLDRFKQVEKMRAQMKFQMDKINATLEQFDSIEIQKQRSDLMKFFDSVDEVEDIFRKVGEQGDLLNIQEQAMNEEYLMVFWDAGHKLGQKQKILNMKDYIKSLDEAVKNIDDFILKINNKNIREIEIFENISNEAVETLQKHIKISDELLNDISK